MRSALHVAKACLVGCHVTFVTLSRCVPGAVRDVKVLWDWRDYEIFIILAKKLINPTTF